MRLQIHLKDRVSGKTSVIEDVVDDTDLFVFRWEEGNLACDCNRVLHLYGWDSPEAKDHKSFNCKTDRIVVEKIIEENGTVIYREDSY